jgi:RNA polymerase sigma-70 factor (ECF subfamily)
MQDVYTSVFKALPGFREESSFYTWIYRIALNKSLSAVKKKKEKVLADEQFPEIPVEDTDKGEQTRQEELGILRECIQELPDGFRTVVVMRDVEGLSYEEIASVEKVPVGTIRSRLNRGRTMLKDIFLKRRDRI